MAKIRFLETKEILERLPKEEAAKHCYFTVKFIVNRGVTHELVRHRIASFCQESTRYVNYKKKGIIFIVPPQLQYMLGQGGTAEYLDLDESFDVNAPAAATWLKSLFRIEKDYNQLLRLGWKPEEARDILPNALKAEIVVTANMREWRHIFKMRFSKAAHPQMKEIMQPLIKEVKSKLEVIFDDIEDELHES